MLSGKGEAVMPKGRARLITALGSVVLCFAFVTLRPKTYVDTYKKASSQTQQLDLLVRKEISSLKYRINKTAAGLVPNNTRDNVVFYNRVPKCGSRSLGNVILLLSTKNKFRRVDSKKIVTKPPLPLEKYTELSTVASYKPPLLYNRHIYFMDFKRAGLRPPIYINMIRDPIERFASHYNYLKYGDAQWAGLNKDVKIVDINECVMNEVDRCVDGGIMYFIGNYFCGLDFDACQKRDDPNRLALAKKHIDEDYLVVGLLEEFQATLLLLEAMLPGYFEGASDVWEKRSEIRANFTSSRKDVLTEESKRKLRENLMKDEYEVYFHAKKKFDTLKKRYLIQYE